MMAKDTAERLIMLLADWAQKFEAPCCEHEFFTLDIMLRELLDEVRCERTEAAADTEPPAACKYCRHWTANEDVCGEWRGRRAPQGFVDGEADDGSEDNCDLFQPTTGSK